MSLFNREPKTPKSMDSDPLGGPTRMPEDPYKSIEDDNLRAGMRAAGEANEAHDDTEKYWQELNDLVTARNNGAEVSLRDIANVAKNAADKHDQFERAVNGAGERIGPGTLGEKALVAMMNEQPQETQE